MSQFNTRCILIGQTPVGPDYPVYVVAEIGINHNGDMDLAKAMILAAQEAGADAVKFQNYKTDDFIYDRSLTFTYQSQGVEICESQYDMFKRYELSDQDVADLAAFAFARGIDFHSTPTNPESVQLLLDSGVGVLKNGSDYLGDLSLIRAMGETGLPTVLSTGMAGESEIAAAVDAFAQTGNPNLILLHCVSKYPAPVGELNLRRMNALKVRFGCMVGFSDHSEGAGPAGISSALGSAWLEKHFTTDRGLAGPDHRFSSIPDELEQIVHACRSGREMMGTAALSSQAAEDQSKDDFTLSCVAAQDFETGHQLARKDILLRRPGTGWPAARADALVGQTLRQSIKKGAQFAGDHVTG